MANAIADILGSTPDPLAADYETNMRTVIAAWETLCPIARGTTFYFDSLAGNDSNDGLSEGAPKQTISAMNTVIGANAGCAIKLKCGSVWRTETTIALGTGSISSYGSGSKPRITGFTQTIAAGAGSFTSAAGDRYTTTAISTLGWLLCESLPLSQPMRLVASTAEVEATPYSWYASGGTLHVNIDGVDPNLYDWAATPASGSAFDGITHGAGSRIDGIRVDGQSCRSTFSQDYAIQFAGTTDEVGCVTNCELYYHHLHNGGTLTTGTGGRLLYKSCTMGWCYDDTATLFVNYMSGGGNESIVADCSFPYGALPKTAAKTGAECKAVYSHTDGSGTVDALHVINCTIPTGTEFAPSSLGNAGNFAAVTDPHDSPYVFYKCVHERTGLNAATLFWNSNMVWAACRLFLKPRDSTTLAMSITPGKGWIVACYIDVDWSDFTSARNQYGLCNATTSTDHQPRIINSWIHTRHNGIASKICAAINRDLYDAAIVADRTDQLCINSIFTAEGKPGSNTCFIGIGNVAANDHHNAVFGFDGSASTTEERAYGAWANTVALGALPDLITIDTVPALLAELKGVGDTSYVNLPAYNLLGEALAVPGADIGPLGVAAASGGGPALPFDLSHSLSPGLTFSLAE